MSGLVLCFIVVHRRAREAHSFARSLAQFSNILYERFCRINFVLSVAHVGEERQHRRGERTHSCTSSSFVCSWIYSIYRRAEGDCARVGGKCDGGAASSGRSGDDERRSVAGLIDKAEQRRRQQQWRMKPSTGRTSNLLYSAVPCHDI